MNFKRIAKTVGFTMTLESLFMLLPMLVAIIYKEKIGLWFVPIAIVVFAIGFPLTRLKIKQKDTYMRDGFASVALSWIVMSVFGCLPFCLSGSIDGFLNSFFEIVSGFTTTGASVLTSDEINSMSKCMLFWRSFSNWAGGMGVLVFILAFAPSTGDNTIHILRAESTGPSVNKIASKMKSTATILYFLYIGLTLTTIILLLLGGMPLYDAIVHSFATAGTGGFSVQGSSIAAYDSFYLQSVITIFMALFGVNFSLYYLLLIGDFKSVLKNEELRWYVLVIVFSIVAIALNIRDSFSSFYESLHHAAFQVSSIITTTGFTTCDFDTWPVFSKTLLVLLMFCGACGGSTGGGIKFSRLIILFKTFKKEIYTLIHPRGVKVMMVDGKKLEHETLRRTNVFLVCYIIIFVVSHLILSFDKGDFTTHFSSVAATLNNIGPGLGLVGASGNFDFYSPLSKLVLIFDMLFGRLEIFPLLLLISPSAWKKN